jgi:hypothetical protein
MINALVMRTQQSCPPLAESVWTTLAGIFIWCFERRQTVIFLLLLCIAENAPTTAAKPA